MHLALKTLLRQRVFPRTNHLKVLTGVSEGAEDTFVDVVEELLAMKFAHVAGVGELDLLPLVARHLHLPLAVLGGERIVEQTVRCCTGGAQSFLHRKCDVRVVQST